MTRVNWRDMQTEELGSVYESLLELIPLVHLEARAFAFAAGDAANRGNERKTTGSYYTPDSLVQLLLATTLDPVLDAAESRNPSDPAAEILKLSIIDPACGSGHFLLAAARRSATRIARHRSQGAPSQEAFQHALREVVSNGIFGVDRNPMAIELCKVALWIEALEPGKPLSFLDARIRCGDSLIGVFDYAMLRGGLPDEAFDPLTGDDKAVAKAYKALNRKQRDGKMASGIFDELRAPASIGDGAAKVLAMTEDTLEEIEAKSRAWNRLLNGPDWRTTEEPPATCMWRPSCCPRSEMLPIPATPVVFRCRRPMRSGTPSAAAMSKLTCRRIASRRPRQTASSTGPWNSRPSWHGAASMRWWATRPGKSRSTLQDLEFFAVRDDEIATAAQSGQRPKQAAIKAPQDGRPWNNRRRDCLERVRIWLQACDPKRRAYIFSFKTGRFSTDGVPVKSTPTPCLPSTSARLARAPREPEPVRSIAPGRHGCGRCAPADSRGGRVLSCRRGSRRTAPPAPSSAI